SRVNGFPLPDSSAFASSSRSAGSAPALPTRSMPPRGPGRLRPATPRSQMPRQTNRTETVADDPSSGRRRAREIKIMLRHGIRTGKHDSHVAEKRQKASNENEPAAISHEQPLTDSYASFREPETSAVSHQQLMPESPADPKADDLAQNCCED